MFIELFHKFVHQTFIFNLIVNVKKNKYKKKTI